jgi:PAS domain S-box-containing protein
LVVVTTYGKPRPVRAEAFLDSLHYLVSISSYLGQYLACNKAFTEALGWTEDELRDFGFADLAPPDKQRAVLEMGGAILKEAGIVRRTYARPMRHKDGSYLVVEWTAWADPENRLVYAIGCLQEERLR